MKPGDKSADPVPPKLRRRMQQIAALKPHIQKSLLNTVDAVLKSASPSFWRCPRAAQPLQAAWTQRQAPTAATAARDRRVRSAIWSPNSGRI